MTDFRRLFGEAVAQSIKDQAAAGEIRPGYWLVRLVKGGPLVPAMIAWCSHEPGNPENELSTGPVLVAEIAGQSADPLDVWAARAEHVIDAARYRFEVADLAWCREHAPAEPKTSPRKKIDLLQAPLPW